MNGFDDLEKAGVFLCRSRKWIRQNLSWLPHFRVNGQLLFREDELLKAMERFREKPVDLDLPGLLARVVPPRPRGARGRFKKGAE